MVELSLSDDLNSFFPKYWLLVIQKLKLFPGLCIHRQRRKMNLYKEGMGRNSRECSFCV